VSQLAITLVAVLVAWGTSPWAASDPVVLSLVLLALAAASCAAVRVVAPAPSFGVVPPTRGEGRAPLLRSRATDPTHHPLAPRAPGLV
jgi:hypothetical protein